MCQVESRDRKIRAIKTYKNSLKELLGMKVNEVMWEKVDAVKLTAKTPKGCCVELMREVNFPEKIAISIS